MMYTTFKMADEFVEAEVCAVGDIADGEMKEVKVDGKSVLLTFRRGVYNAIGAKCSHFGASLINGVFCDNHVRCPWHGACFNVATGDIEDFPGIDSLPKFEVKIVNKKVIVKAQKAALEKSRTVKPMKATLPLSDEVVLIIGGGPAATVCAMTLRQEGYRGQITLLCKEPHLPYDRSKLSKALNSKPEEIALRDQKFYDEYHIQCLVETEVTDVDTGGKRVVVRDGKQFKYDKLVIASGTHARSLSSLPGANLANIVSLRTVDDARDIATNAQDKDVVIIGASFIGVEVAVSLVNKAKTVTLVATSQLPFQSSFGAEVGRGVKMLLDQKGVQFKPNTTAAEFMGANGKLNQVKLRDGTTLPADLCVVGIGAVPSSSFLKNSRLELTSHGFIPVNKHMETKISGVYAVGDVAVFPLFLANDELVNIQHWQMSHQHGRVCAMNIAGKTKEVHSVPYFWTVIFGKSLRYCGYGGFDDVIIHGSVDDLKFIAFYTKGDNVTAVASMNFDPVVSQAAELFLHKQPFKKSDILMDPLGWTKKVGELSMRLMTKF